MAEEYAVFELFSGGRIEPLDSAEGPSDWSRKWIVEQWAAEMGLISHDYIVRRADEPPYGPDAGGSSLVVQVTVSLVVMDGTKPESIERHVGEVLDDEMDFSFLKARVHHTERIPFYCSVVREGAPLGPSAAVDPDRVKALWPGAEPMGDESGLDWLLPLSYEQLVAAADVEELVFELED